MADINKTILFELDLKTGKITDETGKVVKSFGELSKQYDKATASGKRYGKQSKELNKLQEDQARSAGLAGAAAFELGRTISDLPFGLVAVSNNISQLGTLFAALVANAKGVKNALILLKQQILGPGGILIAFQAITAAVTIYAQRSKKANKETEDFNDRLSKLNTDVIKLELLANIVRDNTASIEQQTAALKALKKSGFDPTTQSIDEFIAAQQRLAIARATAELFANDIARLEKERLDLLNQSREVLSDLIKAQQEVGGGPVDILKAQVETIRERLNEIREESQLSKNRLQELFKDIGLVETIFGSEDTEELVDGTINAIKKQISELEKLRDSTATTTDQVKNYNDQIKELKSTLDELQTAKSRLSVEVDLVIGKKGKLSLKDLIDGPEQTEAQKWAAGEVEKVGKAVTNEFQKRQASQGERNFFVDTFGVSEENIRAAIDTAQQGLAIMGDVFSAQAEREIAIETNRTNRLNDQLKKRLSNEKLTAEERDKINQEIARNEAQLVEKENAINKRRFEQEKAVNIAMAVVDTFSAATGVLSDTKGGSFARIAGMIAVISAGLANVAMISKQQFVGKAMPTPNLTAQGVAGAGGVQAPSFNVVGSSAQNQLAAAIAGAESQPVKAYVVSSDVSTAQEFDRKIVEGASI